MEKPYKSIVVSARRWFSPTYARTFWSGELYVNGELVVDMHMKDGYGDAPFHELLAKAAREGHISEAKLKAEGDYAYIERIAEHIDVEIYDVRRRRDL